MIADSMRSLVDRDDDLAKAVRKQDKEVDVLEKSIDESCLTLLATLVLACKATPPESSQELAVSTAPDAPQRAHVHTEHGVERPDPYYWTRDREDPELLAYLEAENAFTKEATAHLEPLRKTLFDEMLGYIEEYRAAH